MIVAIPADRRKHKKKIQSETNQNCRRQLGGFFFFLTSITNALCTDVLMKCLKEISELLVSIWMFYKNLIKFIFTFVRIREEVPQFKKEKEISERDFFD